MRTSRSARRYLTVAGGLLAVWFCFPTPPLLSAVPLISAPAGHEASSGVGVAGGGFITVTAVWVTPGLTTSPYYEQWSSRPEERKMHGLAAATYTLMLLELANRSALTLEGFISVNVRMLVEGERVRPVADETLARAFPALIPHGQLERIPPREALTRVYAFPRVTGLRPVAFLLRPVAILQERRRIGQLQEFELRFDPAQLAFPP